MKNATFSLVPNFSRQTSFLLALAFFSWISACSPVKELPPTPAPTAIPTETPTPTPIPETPAIVTTPSPTPTPACSPAKIVKGVIETPLLTKPITYNVYLPYCYTERPDQRYPTLYLFHGQGFTEDQWLRIGASATATRLIVARQIPPMIIVMPFDYSFQQPTDYPYEQVIAEMLIPRIDGDYRTIADREHRAIGGLSRGGAWAIHIGMRHPDLFSAIGAHSPAIFYTDTNTMRLRLRDMLNDEPVPTFYVDAGDSDVEFENVERFASLLDEMNIPHEWHYNIGFHDEEYWSAHVEEYLRWYVSGWSQ